ncbi:MAG: hypothetical protein M3680_08310 [Myxococcota bacterium]|nr:hypothetical protein [Myxococcota bacterium]
MGKTQATPAASSGDASQAEVEAAVGGLSDASAVRLGKVGDTFARKLVAVGLGINGDDLLREAIKRTWAGRRHWKKNNVTFARHLIATMRSIASHAYAKVAGTCAVPALDDIDDADAMINGVVVAATEVDSRRRVAAKEQIDAIHAVFVADDEVLLVLDGLAEGAKGPEIQKDLGITATEYETIMLRMRRGIDRKVGWRL